MAKYDWEFIKPLDQASTIASMTYGNKQITEGLKGMVDSVTGLADSYKQRNTDDILNALYGAQTSADLPNAMNAVQALQARYGRGYDQAKIREAVDTRGSTLGQRDLQAINLQQAQAAQAALPQIKQMQIERLKASGAPQAQIDALSGIDGIDVSSFATGLIGDARDTRDYTDKRNDRAEDVQWRKDQATQQQKNWQADYDYREDESNWKRADDVSKDNPKENTLSYDGEKWVTISNPGISRMDAYGALSGTVGKIIGAESSGVANAKNSRSTATGGGQFIESTWIDVISRNRPDLIKGKSRQQILDMRNNLELSKQMTEALARENAQGLQKAGLPVTESTIYLSHFAGLGGAKSLLRANPNASAETVLGSSVAKANPEVVKGKTVADVINWAERKIGGQSSTSTASAASNAIQIPQATAAKAVSGYNAAITELQNKFNLQTSQDQSKTAMGSKGQTIDSWITAKDTKDREGSTLITDYARKVAKLARNNAKLSNLPMDDQLKILDAAHSWALAPGGYITDKELNKYITGLATRLIDGKKAELEQGKKNIFEAQYQAFVQEMNAAGMPAVDRDAFRQLVSPKSATKSTKAAPKTSLASQATKAVAKKGEVPNPFHSRPAREPVTKPANQAFIPYANAGVKDRASVRATPKLPFSSTANMTPQQINDLLKKYNVR